MSRTGTPPPPAPGPAPAGGDDLRAAVQRPGSLWQTMRAVAWSFLGIRRSSGHEQDLQKLNPVHVIVAGVVAAALFVLALLLLVNWIVGSGVAA